MTAEKSKKRKVVSTITAVTAAAAILLTGTFAWQSISQKAINEAASTANPGGRLHDDFDGENKDIYVENFGNDPIFARIRLDEYMETGKDAGVNKNDPNRDATPILEGTNINDVSTWTTHIPGETHDAFHDEYWTWSMGGSTVFMPTFNKNKDSLAADVNGTFAGPDNDPETDDDRYADYHAYAGDETKEADAIYDNDNNNVDEGAEAVDPDNITKVPETHTAKSTLNGTVMTMAQWKADGAKPGDYWVYDTDGWAYWANPIAPGEATGLLLDKIELKQDLADWYYAINVEGQFATADDLGSQTDGSGFFKDGMTDDALALLGGISGNIAVVVTAENGANTVYQNDTLQLHATFRTFGQQEDNPAVTWSVSGNTTDNTTIDENGLLTVAPDELADSLTVTAVYQADNSLTGSYTVSVDKINVVNVTPETATVAKGSTQTFTAETVTVSGKTLSNAPVTWSVTGGDSGTSISTDGVLTVAADETADTLTVQATSQHVNTVVGTATVTVKEPSAADIINGIEPASTTTVKIDNIDWYVLAKEEGKALLLSKNTVESRKFDAAYEGHSTPDNRWSESEMRNYLNGEWLNNHETLKEAALDTTLYTLQEFDSTEVDETVDRVFLLSEADVCGKSNGTATSDTRLYTTGTQLTAPGGSWKIDGGDWWWQRSPLSYSNEVAIANGSSVISHYYYSSYGVRPSLWVDLSKLSN